MAHPGQIGMDLGQIAFGIAQERRLRRRQEFEEEQTRVENARLEEQAQQQQVARVAQAYQPFDPALSTAIITGDVKPEEASSLAGAGRRQVDLQQARARALAKPDDPIAQLEAQRAFEPATPQQQLLGKFAAQFQRRGREAAQAQAAQQEFKTGLGIKRDIAKEKQKTVGALAVEGETAQHRREDIILKDELQRGRMRLKFSHKRRLGKRGGKKNKRAEIMKSFAKLSAATRNKPPSFIAALMAGQINDREDLTPRQKEEKIAGLRGMTVEQRINAIREDHNQWLLSEGLPPMSPGRGGGALKPTPADYEAADEFIRKAGG
ncbi:MAG: hypothetical protein GY700_06400 [Propionibacteriaceae bacterium]|nr:hypothetical protein [Propionibacteriaceae bacterium]